MRFSDIFRLDDIWKALSLLSRLPCPPADWNSDRPAARSAWAYPLAGLLVAALAASLGAAVTWLGGPAGVTAGFVLIAMAMMTGAMHEDGLADCADGFWGGWDRSRRLDIMRDSRIGTYGVLALVFSGLIRWAALTALINAGSLFAGLIASALLSRAAMVAVMAWLPFAREDGLAHDTGRPGMETAAAATGLGLCGALALLGTPALAVGLGVAVTMVMVGLLASRKIGGQTGDVLGATQNSAEVVALSLCVALI
ncbi:MAG: adenosylcobinamide-GDP ribazoletransferase [Pseudomonadota bacterium]